ncbi:MAG: hypothetical protein JRN15_02960 [Nitrososphaerota archaeon]|nr:hypothetical protein [Nitrososphaerota archaeon]
MAQVPRSRSKPSEDYRFSKATFVLGIVLFSLDNFFFELYRQEFGTFPYLADLVFASLLIFIAAAASLSVCAFSFLRAKRREVTCSDSVIQWSLGKIVSDVFYDRRRLLLSTTLAYAIFFAFVDAILVYQPNVDFALAYAVSGPTWRVVLCCGLPGYVPVGLFYLPSMHFGLELIPLSLMLMILVSTLVGLNVTLLHESYTLSRSKPPSPNRGIFGSIAGAALGLFVGCPTCAATFLLSMIAGTGSLAFAGLVSAYQPLIAAVTIPLLLFSVLWQANSIRTMLRGCTPQTLPGNTS